MCTNCSRLSHNLLNCEKCGSPLSPDNESVCYSAEPKRVRPQPTTLSSHSNSANGSSVLNSNNINVAVSGQTVMPTPQGLFVNRNAVTATPATNNSTGIATVRPQALFVNLNNQTHAVMNASSQSSATSTAAQPRASMATVQSTVASQPTVATETSTLSLRPSEPSIVTSSLGNLASLTSDHRSSSLAMSSASNGQLVGSNHQSSGSSAGSNASTTEVTINAYQIRIGTRKFVPISPVSFKEDGILFTLKGWILLLCCPLHKCVQVCTLQHCATE